MKFIGIDLGWQSGPSGLCCLTLSNDSSSPEDSPPLEKPLLEKPLPEQSLSLETLERKATLAEVLAWLDEIAPPGTPAIVAVDAPTLIPNETGMRVPDRLAHKYFGKYHAGCYPANLNRPFAQRLVQFGLDLETRGYAHAPVIEPQKAGRYQIEVFPHPAMIQLFNLSQILKYKKGRLAQRAEALGQLRESILTRLPTHNPPLQIESLPEIPTTGKALKALEDQLDSIICAYVAAYWWFWGAERNFVLGDTPQERPCYRATGYIVIPVPPNAPVQVSATTIDLKSG